MQWYGVGAPPNEMTARPARSPHANRGRRSRLTRKKPLRSFTVPKCTIGGPPASTTPRLRMIPDTAKSARPSISASAAPRPGPAVTSETSKPARAKCPPCTATTAGA